MSEPDFSLEDYNEYDNMNDEPEPTPPNQEPSTPNYPKGLQKELMDVIVYLKFPSMSLPLHVDVKLAKVFKALQDYDNELAHQLKVIDELEEEIKKPQSGSGVTLPKQVVVQMYDRDIRLLGIISKLKGAQDD